MEALKFKLMQNKIKSESPDVSMDDELLSSPSSFDGKFVSGESVDTTDCFRTIFGGKTEFATFDEFSELFVKFENESKSLFRVKNSSSVEAENRRRKDQINSAVKYSGLVLCCVHYGEPKLNGKNFRKGQRYLPQQCEAHVYLRYRSSSQKLAIVSANLQHNHQLPDSDSFYPKKVSVTERIGKQREGFTHRRKVKRSSSGAGLRKIKPYPDYPQSQALLSNEEPVDFLNASKVPLQSHMPLTYQLLFSQEMNARNNNNNNNNSDLYPHLRSSLLSHGLSNSRADGLNNSHADKLPSIKIEDVRTLTDDTNDSPDFERLLEPEVILQCDDEVLDAKSQLFFNNIRKEAANSNDLHKKRVRSSSPDVPQRTKPGSKDESDLLLSMKELAPLLGRRSNDLSITRIVKEEEKVSKVLEDQRNLPPPDEAKFVVTWKEMEPLFRFCSQCGTPVDKKQFNVHKTLSVTAVCKKGHVVFWETHS